MANGDIDVGNKSAARKSGQQQMAGAMSQQGSRAMGDNECAPQKLVRLVGCRDPKPHPDKAGLEARMRQFDVAKR